MRIFLATLFMMIAASTSVAKTYECEAVDSIAKLGISPVSAVTVSADEDADECKFSVNGAKVGSPPQEQISEAFERLLNSRLIFSDQFDTNGIAALLLAAGPDDTTDSLASLLADVEQPLVDCIGDLNTRDIGSTSGPFVKDFSLNGGSGVCAVLGSGEFEFGPMNFRFDEGDAIPVLLIFIQRGNLTNLLAIPKR